MIAPPHLLSQALAAIPHIRHGFFTREGGVSSGVFATLNTGLGSSDDAAAIAENRARCARTLELEPVRLLTLYQVHSATAISVDTPFTPDARPKADGMGSGTRALGLGVLAADCAPVLFADREAPVVGAAHAGWKGALTGILEATLAAMEAKGAARMRITAAIGPCISGRAYEVGPEFEAAFLAGDGASGPFFIPGKGDRRLFDLPAYVARRLQEAGVSHIERLDRCTYEESDRFFSYRRATHRGEPDYGRNLSLIALR